MKSVLDAIRGIGRILASLKEIPYLERLELVEILDNAKKTVFSVLKIGEP